jgi:dihydroxy-acid dehydratase
LRALLRELGERLRLDCLTINGKTLGENIADAKIYNDDVIRTRDKPLSETGGLAVLRGNLAPNGAVMKPSAASAKFLRHRGRALVFDSQPEMQAAMNDEGLDVDENTVLVLRNAGPVGAPGMPEWGMLPIPKKLLKLGVRDMVRISDARMSGTAYGTVVLHVAPEAAAGGPLALVRTGDIIELDVAARLLALVVDDAELMARHAHWKPPAQKYLRGYARLYMQHVTQAHEGCDFDFLEGTAATPEPPIF